MPRPAVSPQARALSQYKPVIVIDPGRGGDDAGAQAHGAVEKTVVLEFSLKLREKLNTAGRYKVLMTREADVSVDLQARREFAERNLASIYIAVHAHDAGSHAKGVGIASLHDASEEARLAARKALPDEQLGAVKPAEGDVGAIREILGDLARREIDMNGDRTDVLVKSLSLHLGEQTPTTSDTDSGSTVPALRTAKLPSVLIQLGNIANTADAENVRSNEWQDKVSTSILAAIDSYFSHSLARLPM